uniref:Uncharacterized protein LOC100368612 n=1 Tax=Saccoglossus kowalevskii TaxID=10224 RepID=A0ABM0LXG9_SACKO|nr:PREDICTED: uncharacterized protein LOC100368612 [Saccoglossus kowalevskii]
MADSVRENGPAVIVEVSPSVPLTDLHHDESIPDYGHVAHEVEISAEDEKPTYTFRNKLKLQKFASACDSKEQKYIREQQEINENENNNEKGTILAAQALLDISPTTNGEDKLFPHHQGSATSSPADSGVSTEGEQMITITEICDDKSKLKCKEKYK